MKKTLIAIAAIAATSAFAQSTVTIDGVFDSGFVQVDAKGAKASGIGQNLTDTSAINFRGKTDLGGGLVADFRFASNFSVVGNSSNTTTFGSGEIYAGLKGVFGYVKMGALNGMGLTHTLTSQPFGTVIGSGYGKLLAGSGLETSPLASDAKSSLPSGALRFDNAFSYTTPELMSGLTAQVFFRKQQLSLASAADGRSLTANQQGVMQIGLNYSKNGLNIAVSRLTDDATNLNPPAPAASVVRNPYKAITNNLAVNYALDSSLTLFAGYQGINQTGNSIAGLSLNAPVESRYMNFGAKYVTGVHTFAANYGRFTLLRQNGLAVNSDNAASILGLGYEYALSKTVALTARVESAKDEVGLYRVTGATAGQTGVSTTALGMRMSF